VAVNVFLGKEVLVDYNFSHKHLQGPGDSS
jgi:hypothetical protein